uniref:DUF642 domain-containing protein n=1 Tax=Acidiphilium sp. TaxID=527 RepID=UPI00258E37B5
MRLRTILLATGLVVGTAMGSAFAAPINLVANGDFSSVTGGITSPTQFGTATGTTKQFISSWTGNNGYEIWYPSANAAVNVNATGQYTYTGLEKLWSVTAPPSGPGTFVGLDGDQTHTHPVQASIQQVLQDLTVGSTYQVSFNWAGAQMQSRTGPTTEYLAVSLGSQTQNTAVLNNASHGFTGWQTATLDFVASSTSETLKFLSVGTPSGLPPMALLTNVSATDVP